MTIKRIIAALAVLGAVAGGSAAATATTHTAAGPRTAATWYHT